MSQPQSKPTRPPSADPMDQVQETQNRAHSRHWASRWAKWVFSVVLAVTLGCDLASKHLAFRYVAGQPVVLDGSTSQTPGGIAGRHPAVIPPHDPVTLLPGVLSLKLTLNTGAIFGLGRGERGLLITMSIVAVGVILWLLPHARKDGKLAQASLALILAGALGNLYDRIRYGAVRDLLYLFPGVRLPWGWTWPGGIDELYPWIFNIADAALVIGVGAMAVGVYRRRAAHPPTPEAKPGA